MRLNREKFLGGVAGAFAVEVLAEADIERPVQFVLDGPVLADRPVQPLGIGLEAGDVVADFALGLAHGLVVALGLDANQPLQRRPFGRLFDQRQIGDDRAAAGLDPAVAASRSPRPPHRLPASETSP